MTQLELLSLATLVCVETRPPRPITPELLAAICWVESSGNPQAVGDGGKARGLAQFHSSTWRSFARPCPAHRRRTAWMVEAACPRCSMRTLTAELEHAVAHFHRRATTATWIALARFHNSGRLDGAINEYSARVRAALEAFMRLAPTSRPTTQPSEAATP